MIQQRTIKNSVTLTGIGVHSGQAAQLTLHSAAPNTGIIFRRQDIQPLLSIPAKTEFVGDTRLNTCLTSEGQSIYTVEHLMSAFAGLGIDNIFVDLNSAELPIVDGSAKPFVELLLSAGIIEQDQPKKFIEIIEKIEVIEGDKKVSLEPYGGCRYELEIEFDHPAIRASQQKINFPFSVSGYIENVSRARTFGFLSEYEYMKQHKLAQGASLENTVVLDDSKVINETGLRYSDEFVKHKLLDVIGDMYLLGMPFSGIFRGRKSGHHLNHQLRNKLIENPNAWKVTPYDNFGEIKKSFELPL